MTVLAWMIGGEWRAHPGRVIVAVLGIAVGVALGFAIHLVNASALVRFEQGLASVNGSADLRIEAAGGAGFPERLYPRLAHAPGIAAASPVIVLRARVGDASFDLLGLDILRAAVVTPSLAMRPADDGEATAVFDDASVFLSSAAMRAIGTRIGAMIPVSANGRRTLLRVAGTLPGVAADAPIAVIDIAGAQWHFGRTRTLDRIDLKRTADADPAAVRRAIAALLPPTALIADQASDAQRSDALSRAYRVNLDILALVALLTGGFLVFSAQTLSVARRRAQFALLRVLGRSRRAVVGQVMIEGLALGCIGAALGILLGLALASIVLRLVGGDLGSGYFAGERAAPLVFVPGAAIGFALFGIGAAVIGSVLPAREAARAAPAVALKSPGDAIDPAVRPPIMPALAFGSAGIGCAFLPAVRELPLFGYAAMALMLAGGIIAMPWIARTLLRPLARRELRSPAIGLAIARLWGAPGQAAVALSGIVASTALMIAMAVMVTSFRGSVVEWLGQILPADLYLTIADGDTGALDSPLQARLAALPGVRRIVFSQQRALALAADRPAVMLVVRPDPASAYPLIGGAATVPAGRIPVWLSEPAARLYGLQPGATLVLPIGATGHTRVQVAGIFRDYARQHGAIAIDARDYDRVTGDRTRSEAAIDLAPRARPAEMIARLRAALPADLARRAQLIEVATLRLRALAIFDRSFAVTYGLEAVAILVGLAGVATTVSAQTIARTAEFGMLRHLGVMRGQIVTMLGAEGALLGFVGGIAGVALGCVLAQVLIHVVNPQSFNWTMATRLPWALLAGVIAALVIAAAGTAMLAGRRALSADAVRAVREDW